MVKIKRFKRLNEDDNQQLQTTVNQTQNTNQLQPVLNNQQQTLQPQLQQNPAPTQPQLQLTTLDNNQQLGQQVQLQQLDNPNRLKIELIIKNMENVYWSISVSIPEEIQKQCPDFKQGNALADSTIKLWNDFKNNPNEETYKAFVEGLSAFANGGNQQPALDNNQQLQQQNVNASYKAEYSFRKKLMENLEQARFKDYYNRITEDYFDKNEFKLY